MGDLFLDRRAQRRLAGFLALLFLCLATGELFLRAAGALWPRAAVLVSHHRVPDARLGWRLNPAYPDVDEWGFRNPGVPKRADIVVLGDSQSFGYGVAPEHAWPRRLSQLTGRSTYTVASSEFSPVHGFVIWDEIAGLEPDLVVAAVYAGNDLYDVFQLVYGGGHFGALRSKDVEVLARIRALEDHNPLSHRARLVTRMGRPSWPLRDALHDHSRIYHLVRAVTSRAKALGGRTTEEAWDLVRRRAGAHPDYLYAFDGGHARRTVFTVAKRLLPQDASDPRVAEGLRVTLTALERLSARVNEHGARLLVLWIPTKESVFRDLVERAAQAPADYGRLVAAEENVHQQVRLKTRALGVSFVDALPALRACLARGEHPYPIDADGHPRKSGYRAIARAVADRVDSLCGPAGATWRLRTGSGTSAR